MRQLTAIMFTDIVGFTAAMQEDEARAKAMVERHRAAASTNITQHDGELLQFYGDGTLSVFRSAVQAVECAVAIQRQTRGPDGIPLRIGLHTGDVVREGGAVWGDGINVASRIQSLGVRGSVLVSGKLADEVKNQPHLEVRHLGEFSLKNVIRPIRVSVVIGDGLAVPKPTDLPKEPHRRLDSVAVLPFVNMSADPENEFFADGITEEVINVLTRIEDLKVTARTSSFAFKGRNEDVREVGRQLQVATVLEGSVRKAGNRVRVTAQLIDTQNGYHLFSDNYDGDLEDIFATQDEIASAIVRQLQGNFREVPDPGSLVVNETDNNDAYIAYLKGLHHWHRWMPEDMKKALAHFEEATRLDPDWAPPHAFLAGCYVVLATLGGMPPRQAYEQAEKSAATALRVGQKVALAHVAQAMVDFLYHWDFEAAHESFRTALALSPGLAEAHRTYGTFLTTMGDFEGGIRELETAIELDPFALVNHANLAGVYAFGHRLEDALDIADRALHLDPSFHTGVEIRGLVLTSLGRTDEAVAVLERLPAMTENRFEAAGARGFAYASAGRPDDARAMLRLLDERTLEQPEIVNHMDFAMIHVALGELDAGVAYLEKAVEERLGWVLWTPVALQWRPLDGHAGFHEILRKIGRADAIVG